MERIWRKTMFSFVLLAVSIGVFSIGCEQMDGEYDEYDEYEGGGGVGQLEARMTKRLPNDRSVAALVGQGYNTALEDWRSQCVYNNYGINSSANNESRFTFNKAMSQSELESSFATSASAKASFGILNGSMRSNFVKQTQQTSRSISVVYKGSAVTNTKILNEHNLHWIVEPDDPTFFSRCGDSFAQQIKQGGELYISSRMEFASETEKLAYQAAVGASYGPYSGSASVEGASRSFSGRAIVHLEAYQVGGETQYLSTALDGKNAISCSFDNLEPCDAFLEAALDYASGYGYYDFPRNLGRKPADLEYTLRDWASLGAGASAQNVSSAVAAARNSLMKKVKLQVAVQSRFEGLQMANFFGATQGMRAVFEGYYNDSKKNEAVLGEAIKACYDNLIPAKQAIKTVPISFLATPSGNVKELKTAHEDLEINDVPEISPAPFNPETGIDFGSIGFPDFKKVLIDFNNEGVCVSLASDAGLAQKGYKDLTAALRYMDVKLPVRYFEGRYDFNSTVAPGVGPFGSWTSWAMCPAGQYAIGYRMRVEGALGSGHDDTALNAVQLTCANFERTQTSIRTPHPGFWGIWQPEASCTSGPMNSMQIKIEPSQGSGADDTGANDLMATCVSGQSIHAAGGRTWGSWRSTAYCPAGSAICGARIQIEGRQGDGDDTAMNGIDLACCAY